MSISTLTLRTSVALCLSFACLTGCDKPDAKAPATATSPQTKGAVKQGGKASPSTSSGSTAWRAQVPGAVQGELKGTNISVMPGGQRMFIVSLDGTTGGTPTNIRLIINDPTEINGPFESKSNMIGLRDLPGSKKCSAVDGRVTLDSYDKASGKISGSFEGKGRCIKGEVKDFTIKGSFSNK